MALLTHPSFPFLPLHLPVVLFLLLPAVSSANNFCSSSSRTTQCLPSLTEQPELYNVCRTKPCYLFLSEPPFINIPSPIPPPPYTPFPCSSPHPYSGFSFKLHEHTPDALCIYAGPNCSFNDLIHFTSTFNEYQFGITGLMLHTPQRLCNHSAASPFIEDALVIVGHADTSRGISQLVRPFSAWTWMVFLGCLLLIITVAFGIAFFSRGKASVATAVFVAAGNSNLVLRKCDFLKNPEHQTAKTMYSLSMTLLKISVAVLVTLLALFYEAGVVNFLFQQNTAELGKHVRSLSPEELSHYSVLNDSALEQIWNSLVNPDGDLYNPETEEPPWQRCSSSEECIKWVVDPEIDVMFDVTFGITARFLIQQLSSCDKLTTFQTEDLLYHFAGGWLYNEAVPSDYRQQVDRVIIGLRINRTIGELLDRGLDRTACSATVLDPQLGPELVAVPISIVVLPPLVASVLIIFCMKEEKETKEETSGACPTVGNEATTGGHGKNISSDISRGSPSGVMRRASTQELEEMAFP